jgi:hypothetical protein
LAGRIGPARFGGGAGVSSVSTRAVAVAFVSIGQYRENLPRSWSADNGRIPLFDGEKQRKTLIPALFQTNYDLVSN